MRFENPEITVLNLQILDVITTSAENPNPKPENCDVFEVWDCWY